MIPGTDPPKMGGSADRRCVWRLVQAIYNNLRAGLAINLAASAGIALVLGLQGQAWAAFWLAAVVLVSGVRFAYLGVFLRRHGAESIAGPGVCRRWQRGYEAGMLVAVSLWMVVVWFGLPVLDTEGRYVLLIVISAMAAGATLLLAPLDRSARVYLSLLMLPVCLRLILLDSAHWLLASLGVAFYATMLVQHRRLHALLADAIRLKENNADLVTQLVTRNAVIEDLNVGLERRVVERTQALEQLAAQDALTGLLNRRSFVERLEARLATPGAGGVAVLFLDLDRFKQINDGFGHGAGDAVLAAVAGRLRDCLEGEGSVGRWGGDEFVVLVDDAAEDRYFARLAGRFHDAVTRPIVVHGEPLVVGVSIGIATPGQGVDTAPALIRAADLAVAQAKRSGRGMVCHYHRRLSEIHKRRLDIGLGLRQAVALGEFRLAYQPVVDSRSGCLTALEALLRWSSPGLGEVAPGEFVAIAEESDRIVEIGAWVMAQACRDAAAWGGDKPAVAVNVSVRQLLAPGFVAMVAAALAAAGLPPHRLHLEVTESVFAAENTALAFDALSELHDRGIAIHLDDFGTGYSSLSRLQEFPLDAIKIDRAFVNELERQGAGIIEGALLIARRFGLRVVAEGVETPQQAARLWGLGVDALQGYWFGKPDFTPRLAGFPPSWVVDSSRDGAAAARPSPRLPRDRETGLR